MTRHFFSIAALLGAMATVAPATADTIVVDGNGIQIEKDAVLQRLEAIAQARGVTGPPPESMVEQVIVAMYQSEAMARDAVERGLDQRPEVAEALQQARQQVLAGALMTELRDGIDVPDLTQAARDHYDTHLSEFTAPERGRFSHILLKLDCDCISCDCLAEREEEATRAKALLQRLDAGENFTQLAVEQSEDTATASRGGSLGGWIARADVDPQFAKAAFQLEPGELSDIVETRFGFHIIRMDDYAAAKTIPFEDVESGIVEKLEEQFRTRELAKRSQAYETQAKEATWNAAAVSAIVAAMTPAPADGEPPPEGTAGPEGAATE